MKLGTSNCFDLDTFIHDKTKRYTMQVHVAIYHVKKNKIQTASYAHCTFVITSNPPYCI